MFDLPLSTRNDNSSCVDLYRGGKFAGVAGSAARLHRLAGYDFLFIASLTLVCGLSVFIGIAAPLGSYAHDTFFLLSNAYRVAHGQVPSRDFSSAWGPVMFLIEAAGLELSGMRPAGIGYANALFGGLLASWAFLIVRQRWSPPSACVAGVFTLFLVSAPFPLGHLLFDFGYSMIYNRYGYAIFGILMLECGAVALAGRSPPHSGAASLTGSLSTGLAFGLLALLKISFAIVAAPFILLSLIDTVTNIRLRLIGLFIGFAAIAALEVLYLRFDVIDMIRDLQMAAAARSLSLQIIHPIGRMDVVQGVTIVAGSLLICRANWDRSNNLIARLHWPLFGLLTLAAGYLLLISNQQPSAFPLDGYAAVILASACPWGATIRLKRLRVSSLIPQGFLLAFCVLPLCAASALSLGLAAEVRQWPKSAPGVSLDSPIHGGSVVFLPKVGKMQLENTGEEYIRAINDGIALLRRHPTGNAGVLAFDEFSPFDYLLNLPTPRGGIAAAAYDYIFSDAAHPSPARFFGTARYVIVRKYLNPLNKTERQDVAALMRIYGPTLRQEFVQIGESKHWVLWQRIKSTNPVR